MVWCCHSIVLAFSFLLLGRLSASSEAVKSPRLDDASRALRNECRCEGVLLDFPAFQRALSLPSHQLQRPIYETLFVAGAPGGWEHPSPSPRTIDSTR